MTLLRSWLRGLAVRADGTVRAPPLRTVTRAAPAPTTPGSAFSDQQVGVESLSGVRRIAAPGFDVREEHAIDAVAEIDGVRLLQRSEKQPGADEEHEAERHLHHDERARARVARTPVATAPPSSRSAATVSGRINWRTGASPNNRPAADADRERERQHAPVKAQLDPFRNAEAVEDRNPPGGDEQAGARTEHAERIDSVSHCWTSWARPAPIAIRTATSRRRVTARASSRLATFAQAMS